MTLSQLLAAASGRPAILIPEIYAEIARDHLEELIGMVDGRDERIERLEEEIAHNPSQSDVDDAINAKEAAETRETQAVNDLADMRDQRDLLQSRIDEIRTVLGGTPA